MTRAAHIAFLSSKHPPLDKRVFDKQAISLQKAGFRITHIAPGDGESFTKAGIEVVLYPPPDRLIDRVKQIPRLYRLAVKVDADCYHCNEVDSWFVGVLLKVFRRRKCIFDVHEHYPSTFAQRRFPRFLRPVVAGLVRLSYLLMLPFTDNVVLAKKTVARDFWLAGKKLVLVRNYSTVSALSETVANGADTIGATDHSTPLRLVHLGLTSRARGWPQLLDALSVARNSDISLLFIGSFIDDSQPEFDARVAELALTERVVFEDWMPFKDAFTRLLQCDVGLIAFQPGIQNHIYAMPHKLFDYMLAGLAVIIPGFAVEVAPVVSDSKCGILVDPSNVGEIASCIDALADDREKCETMGRHGKSAVIAQYNWEGEVAKLIEMYRELTDKR